MSEEKNLEIESIKNEDGKVILVMKKAGEIDAGINKGSYVDISCSDNPLITLGNGSLTSKNVSFNNGIITTISISLSQLSVPGIIGDKFTITDPKAKKSLVPSVKACLATSSGRRSLTAVWISRELRVLFLL